LIKKLKLVVVGDGHFAIYEVLSEGEEDRRLGSVLEDDVLLQDHVVELRELVRDYQAR